MIKANSFSNTFVSNWKSVQVNKITYKIMILKA